MNSAIILFAIMSIALGVPYDGQRSQVGHEGHGPGQGQGGNEAGLGGSNSQLRQSQGKSFGGLNDNRYGASLIDTPTMVGYEAMIPGATSRFVKYRNEFGRSSKSQDGFGQDGHRGLNGPSSQGHQAGFRNSQGVN